MPQSENPTPKSEQTPKPTQTTPSAKHPGVARQPYQSLGSIRDYFSVQLEQDASWQHYHPNV